MATFRVGTAQVDFTPRIGLPLFGNYRDDYAARGVHDLLYARALVLQNASGDKVALLSVDLCVLDRAAVSRMRAYISSRCDIPAGRILIAATHTHSGPPTVEGCLMPPTPEADLEAFLTKAASAVVSANANLNESGLFVGHGSEDRLSFNRRLKCKDGTTHMNWEGLDPDFVAETLGPIDPQVTTLSIQQDTQCAAGIVNFGLHPAILAGDNWLYSADYPGYLAEALSRIYGDGFVTLFFNGPCGNVNHIDARDPTQGRGYQMTQRVGYMLAVATHEAMRQGVAVEGDTLAATSEKVVLKRLKISDEDRRWCERVLAEAQAGRAPGQVDGLPDEYYATIRLEMAKQQEVDDEAEVMAVRIGNLGIVGIPGEMFCEFGLDIKKRSPAKHTMVFGLANDALGYFPTRPSFELGGYEIKPGSTRYEPGTGEALAESAVRQLKKLFS